MSKIQAPPPIKCPKCRAEYLTAEIFIPKSFVGEPRLIDKDESGIIQNHTGTNMNVIEHYKCDYCNTPFKIGAKIQFVTAIEEKYDFDTDYVSSLKKETLFLRED